MKFWILVENTVCSPEFTGEHGLSILAESNGKKILFDMGRNGLFAQNAQKMGLCVGDVEHAVISHGHYDHGRGILVFLEQNQNAQIWLQRTALEEHYSRRKEGRIEYIGLPHVILNPARTHLLDGDAVIDENLRIFSRVKGRILWPQSNKTLLKKVGVQYIEDDFIHEQHLLLVENGLQVLLTGCSHCGIINILNDFVGKTGRAPDVVIGGFHLSKPSTGESEPPEIVDKVGEQLKKFSCRYYTGHCTGEASFKRLKAILGDRIQEISTGMTLEF